MPLYALFCRTMHYTCRQDQCSYITLHSSSNLAVHRFTVHRVLPSPSYTALSRNMAADLGSLLSAWQESFAKEVAGTAAPHRPLLQPEVAVTMPHCPALQPGEPIPPWRPLQPPPVPVSGLPLSSPPPQEEPPSGSGWDAPMSGDWGQDTSWSSWEAPAWDQPASGYWHEPTSGSSWEAPTSEHWGQDTSGSSWEAPTSGDWGQDCSWSSWEAPTSGSTWEQPTSDQSGNWTDVGKGGRVLEPQRSGVNGGRDRKGQPGGQNKEYYKMLYGIKANKGKAAMQRFISMFGHHGSGGAKFHDRKSD